jgi:hypothetical protein
VGTHLCLYTQKPLWSFPLQSTEGAVGKGCVSCGLQDLWRLAAPGLLPGTQSRCPEQALCSRERNRKREQRRRWQRKVTSSSWWVGGRCEVHEWDTGRGCTRLAVCVSWCGVLSGLMHSWEEPTYPVPSLGLLQRVPPASQ